ncbi:MAG: hypothetical protein M9930_19950 [Anaerolineae bacterium]|nr:hypothetical protein [Anaerolineae bacterium]
MHTDSGSWLTELTADCIPFPTIARRPYPTGLYTGRAIRGPVADDGAAVLHPGGASGTGRSPRRLCPAPRLATAIAFPQRITGTTTWTGRCGRDSGPYSGVHARPRCRQSAPAPVTVPGVEGIYYGARCLQRPTRLCGLVDRDCVDELYEVLLQETATASHGTS